MENDYIEAINMDLKESIALVDKNKLEINYGSNNNWGDLLEFRGNYINFGYWKNMEINQLLSEEDRIESSKNLYLHIIEQLCLVENDDILEIGCGRGTGLNNIIEQRYTVKSIIGIDIVAEQIAKAQQAINQSLHKDIFIKLLVASASATTLKDQSVDKVYSVEVVQHFKTCIPFAKEIKRILKPGGKLIFTAQFSTNEENYRKVRQENLIIDGDELLPIHQIVREFKHFGFDVSYYSIGEHVFEGYEKWVSQIKNKASCSHYLYKAYQKKYIDYFVVVVQ